MERYSGILFNVLIFPFFLGGGDFFVNYSVPYRFECFVVLYSKSILSSGGDGGTKSSDRAEKFKDDKTLSLSGLQTKNNTTLAYA